MGRVPNTVAEKQQPVKIGRPITIHGVKTIKNRVPVYDPPWYIELLRRYVNDSKENTRTFFDFCKEEYGIKAIGHEKRGEHSFIFPSESAYTLFLLKFG